MTANAVPGKRPYFAALDGVRAVAALMVMVFHFSQFSGQSHLLVLGQTGVDLFFVLSGFLITSILLAAPASDWHEVRKFYIRRSLRILPLYYLYLTLAAAFGAFSWWYWVYLQNIPPSFGVSLPGPAHLWSLAVEEHFYLFWPFLIFFVPRRYTLHAIWAVIIFSTLSRAALAYTRVDIFYLTITRLDGLAFGGLLAFGRYRKVLESYREAMAVLTVVSAIMLILVFVKTHGKSLPIVHIFAPTLTSLCYTGVVGLLVATADSPVHRLLSAKPLRSIGAISYGLYVYHPVVFHFVLDHRWGLPTLACEAIAFCAVYTVAWLSWNIYEKRWVALKDRLSPEKKFQTVDVHAA